MWEAHGMENEDFLWAGIPFIGGIAGHQDAPCGAISTGALFLGLKNRCPVSDKEKAKEARNKSRNEAGAFVKRFTERFGSISCQGLIGVDLSDATAAKQFWDSGKSKDTCEKYVSYAIELLFEEA